ncbi:Ig-like domain-containing protein [Emticicia sp. TH156]|uniref:Ig-like domain-containing protein n=1 Tax=Emticicia sp. TH156 TaxID=2067454 RepID=UPI000C7591B5|nr:Ig-like domain-containing protein [Emticicia sp. TH156]PLK44368.1 hypothetical protein C0V77_11310 [Emticicia sp. TH156]
MKRFSPMLLVLCVACTTVEEPLTIMDDTNVQLKYDGSHQFVVKRGNSIVSSSEITWQSADTKVGNINKSGKFEGRKIGITEVTAATQNGSFKAEVEIEPYYNTYSEPVLDFYSSKQSIKAKEKRELVSDDGIMLVYHIGNTKAERLIYFFEKDQLIGCGVFFTDKSFKKEVNTFLRERYPEAITRGDLSGYLADTEQFAALINEQAAAGLAVTYLPQTVNGRRIANSDAQAGKVLSLVQSYNWQK